MGYTDPTLYSTKELADILKVGRGEVMSLARSGFIPAPIYINKEARWPREDICLFLDSLSRQRWRDRSTSKGDPATGELPKGLDPVRSYLRTEAEGPTIYFLFKNLDVIYVGSSVTPMRRVEYHRRGDKINPPKDFDTSYFLQVDLEEMLEIEEKFIAILDPPLNKKSRY